MEQAGPPAVVKKLWKIVWILFFMIRKGTLKSKMMVDLRQLMMKLGKLASKAIGNLIFHHHSAFSCRSHDDAHLSFVTPREYEFSCSNSPAYPTYFLSNNKRNKKKNHHRYFSPSPANPTLTNDDITAVTAVQKLLEMLNNEIVEASPVLPGFGFGRSPMVRQLRITYSPFPLKDNNEEDSHVDKEAEEFIIRFNSMSNSGSKSRLLYRRHQGIVVYVLGHLVEIILDRSVRSRLGFHRQ